MQITSFTIAEDRSQMDLTITDAATVLALRLWNQDTYKDFGKLIDLSAKLTGATTEKYSDNSSRY